MKKDILLKCLLMGMVASVGAFAEMTVDKSSGVLTVTSSMSGTVIAKVIGPNDKVVVNTKTQGNSFTWTPSGVDGAYRYDVRVIPTVQKTTSVNAVQAMGNEDSSIKNDYAGGSVEILNGSIVIDKPGKE